MFDRRTYRLSAVLLAILSSSLAGACSLHEKTKLTQNRIQVQQERFVTEVPVREMDKAAVAGFARHYNRHGEGPVDIDITYDPRSLTNTAMKAGEEAGRLARAFADEGLDNVSPGILPVRNQGTESIAIVSYMAYEALPPKDCGTLAGYDPNTKIDVDPDYRLGCTIDTVFARQIARPKDLAGQGASGITDGRRASNIVEIYRTGQQNKPLEGETASE